MKCTAILFCLAAIAFAAKAASVSGQAGIDGNSVFAGGRLVFPRIPGLNSPLSNIFPSSIFPSSNSRNGNRSATTTAAPNLNTASNNPGSNTSSNGGSSPLSNIAKLFDIPDPASLIPDLPSNGNSSDAEVPSLPGLPDISQLPKIPGLSNAIEDARQHVQDALELGPNIAEGIQQAMQEAFESDDPISAIRTIIKTIIDAYLTVAANCPLMVVGSRVIQEGIRLAIEAARSARNVVFGTTSAPSIL